MNRRTVLVIEDDLRAQKLICQILEQEGFQTRSAGSIFQAQGQVRRLLPDLVILDRRLPDGDGVDFCRELKGSQRTKSLPILFLTTKDNTADRVVGLKMGGDDYLPKPFHAEELLARIEAILRRTGVPGEKASTKVLRSDGIVLDTDRHECRVNRKVVKLWPKEFELLQVLLERPGRLLSKEFLSERVWGHEHFTSSRAIEIAIQRLRRKLGHPGERIETVKGYGFRLQD